MGLSSIVGRPLVLMICFLLVKSFFLLNSGFVEFESFVTILLGVLVVDPRRPVNTTMRRDHASTA